MLEDCDMSQEETGFPMLWTVLARPAYSHRSLLCLQLCGAGFMMDECRFMVFTISTPIHYKAWALPSFRTDRTFFNITLIVFVWKKKVIYTYGLSKSWGHFHFWVNCPFKAFRSLIKHVKQSAYYFLSYLVVLTIYIYIAWLKFL